MPKWRYIIADQQGTEWGELWQAADRELSIPLAGGRGGATFSTRLALNNPMVGMILQGVPADRLNWLLKIYRDGERMFVSDLWTGEEAAEGPGQETFSISAMGPLHTRLHRLFGGMVSGYSDGTALVQKDLGVLATNIINTINTLPVDVNLNKDTGVRIGTVTASSNGYLEKVYFKRANEQIVELSEQLGGFDFEVEPVEPVADGNGVKIANFNASAAIGTVQAKAIFEYGTGKRNIRSYRRPIDKSGQANRAFHLAPGFPDSVEAGITPIMYGTNYPSALRRLREDVVNADLQPASMRQTMVNEHVRIRGHPRETIFITPIANADVSYGTHYRVGDYVEARAKVGGSVRFNATFRIYGVRFLVDDKGTEQIELTLINEGAQT